jgi:hypothetical protein
VETRRRRHSQQLTGVSVLNYCSSFRDGPQDHTRNLKIPGSRCVRPE